MKFSKNCMRLLTLLACLKPIIALNLAGLGKSTETIGEATTAADGSKVIKFGEKHYPQAIDSLEALQRRRDKFDQNIPRELERARWLPEHHKKVQAMRYWPKKPPSRLSFLSILSSAYRRITNWAKRRAIAKSEIKGLEFEAMAWKHLQQGDIELANAFIEKAQKQQHISHEASHKLSLKGVDPKAKLQRNIRYKKAVENIKNVRGQIEEASSLDALAKEFQELSEITDSRPARWKKIPDNAKKGMSRSPGKGWKKLDILEVQRLARWNAIEAIREQTAAINRLKNGDQLSASIHARMAWQRNTEAESYRSALGTSEQAVIKLEELPLFQKETARLRSTQELYRIHVAVAKELGWTK